MHLPLFLCLYESFWKGFESDQRRLTLLVIKMRLLVWRVLNKGRTIRKLIGGGAGEVQKKYSRKGKLNEKNSCTPINPKKNSYREFDSEKKFLRFENSPFPALTFLMVRLY